jgi:3'-phosphoadenosine 5'-phosphosulfate sulfotransferase (PAPS reductase)/FAD synthetase
VDRWRSRWESNIRRYAELSCVKLILPWSTAMRFCTSELKTSIICRALVRRFPGQTILSATGIRRQESPNRAKAPVAKPQPKLASASWRTKGLDWHPILDWTTQQVFGYLEEKEVPLHEAYTQYGSSRVSCCFCILSSQNDLAAASSCAENQAVYRDLVALEAASTFQFQLGRWLGDVAPHYVAGIRCNQVQRFYEVVRQAIVFVQSQNLGCPHDFSYEETIPMEAGRSIRQRVELTLWDPVSVREHAIALGYKEAPHTTLQRRWREGRYAAKLGAYYVEYRATVSLIENTPSEPFWFLDLFRHRVFRNLEARDDSDVTERRDEFDRKWGYSRGAKWEDDGILSLGSADYRPIDYIYGQEGREFLPYEGLYAAALFST